MNGTTILRRMFTRTEVWVGLIVILGIVVISLMAPLLFPRGPWAMGGRPFLPPMSDMRFPLGTDTTGRDILAGLVWGIPDPKAPDPATVPKPKWWASPKILGGVSLGITAVLSVIFV